MIFSELYNAYYNAVAAILKAACSHPLQKGELRTIVSRKAFGESLLNIEPALLEERWQLLKADGTTPIRSAPSMPLTALQVRWLKALSLDPRIRLFPDAIPDLNGTEPLFTPDDICVFDRYLDGDPYEDETYIRNFRLILSAIRSKTALEINTYNRKGVMVCITLMPERLEYSEKDDKFRLIGSGSHYSETVNLSRIVRCRQMTHPAVFSPKQQRAEQRTVVLDLIDQRNTLERVLMHFAHFQKEAERTGEGRYRVRIVYDKEDEVEMIIRILSFGPMVRVVSPSSFVDSMKKRLLMQKDCGL